MKSITIKDPNAPVEESAAKVEEEQPIIVGADSILDRPIHDTGSKWYAIGSFFLPPIGLIAGFIFKKFKHIRNFKSCLKGALIGFGLIGAVILLFLLLLLLAQI